MLKRLYFLLLVIDLILGDEYDELIKETVTEEYCNNVISNITKLIEEGYIFSDFLKAPIQPKEKESYSINKVDLINELENISRVNRTYYDFIRDIYTIIRKTKDGHLNFVAKQTPNNKNLERYHFFLPFQFKVVDEFDENYDVSDTYLTIEPLYTLQLDIDDSSFEEYYDKPIISINDMDPFQFIEEFPINKKFPFCHSLQCNYIHILENIGVINIEEYPFIKEELPSLTITFEDGEEITVNYEFTNLDLNNKLHLFYLEKKKYNIKHKIPLPSFKKVVKEFEIKNKLNYKKQRNMDDYDDFSFDDNNWDYSVKDETIKCKIDKENEVNVLYQNSFYPEDYDNYEDIMFKCLSEFYSNDYKLIIIESKNNGGYSELCVPFTQYIRPKELNTVLCSEKATSLSYEYLIKGDENLNSETCTPYSSTNELNRNKADIYKDGNTEVIHNRTNEYELYSIYSKKLMEQKRREFLATNKTKKPTEIIVFTDGFSFSCGSIFIKGLQVYGSAIIVGYNAIPGISKSDFDASQSNSAVETFDDSIYSNNLLDLGFNAQVTNMEQFDPNDKDEVKTPMEFKIYPVDIISKISTEYDDEYYERFIYEAKSIFEDYNENNKCNPENKFLYYETIECDSKINIEHGHGGYLCRSDGTWDTSNCILAYCDVGYILNDEKNKCIEDPCESIILNNITLNCEKEIIEYEIEPNQAYIFTIDDNNGNCSCTFYSELDNFFFTYDDKKILKPVKNGTVFKGGDNIYSNIYLNTTENIKINIKAKNGDKEEEEEKEEKTNKYNTYFNRKKRRNYQQQE